MSNHQQNHKAQHSIQQQHPKALAMEVNTGSSGNTSLSAKRLASLNMSLFKELHHWGTPAENICHAMQLDITDVPQRRQDAGRPATSGLRRRGAAVCEQPAHRTA